MAIQLLPGEKKDLYPQYNINTDFVFSGSIQNVGETRKTFRAKAYHLLSSTSDNLKVKFTYPVSSTESNYSSIESDNVNKVLVFNSNKRSIGDSITITVTQVIGGVKIWWDGVGTDEFEYKDMGKLTYTSGSGYSEKSCLVGRNSFGFFSFTVLNEVITRNNGKVYCVLPEGVYGWIEKSSPAGLSLTQIPDYAKTGIIERQFTAQGTYYLCIGRKNEGSGAPIPVPVKLKIVPIYSIAFRSGGNVEEINEQAFNFTLPTLSSLTQITAPDSSYGFLGWCETANSSQIDYADGANFSIHNEGELFYNLFAVWGKKNIATLNFGYPVSETEEIEGWQKAYNSNEDTLFIESGATARLPVKNDAYDHSDGRIFLTKGWRLFRDGEFKLGQDILFEDTFTTILPNDIFYIIYSNNDLGIKYLANGDYTVTGEVPNDFKEQTIIAGTFSDASFVIKQNEYVYGKNKFKYWCDTPDGKGTRYTHGQEVTLESPLTLYGIWDYVGVGGGGATLYYGYKGKWVEVNLGG